MGCWGCSSTNQTWQQAAEERSTWRRVAVAPTRYETTNRGEDGGDWPGDRQSTVTEVLASDIVDDGLQDVVAKLDLKPLAMVAGVAGMAPVPCLPGAESIELTVCDHITDIPERQLVIEQQLGVGIPPSSSPTASRRG